MATTQQLLEEARTAYHSLQLGISARVVVDGQDGSRVEYTAANRSDLYKYIQSLQLALASGGGQLPPTNGPISFIF